MGTGSVHFQFKVEAGGDAIRVPVNVLSDSKGALESRLLEFIVIDDFRHPVTEAVEDPTWRGRIHMNQGNAAGHTGEDGVWNDPGLLIHLPAPEDRWVAFFFAFQNQTFNTDDVHGHTLIDQPLPDTAPVRILAALVNPAGPGDEGESVLLLNASPDPVDLTGRQIADKTKQLSPVPPVPLAGGETLEVPVVKPCALSNSGGIITLLDGTGTKVAGVSYTKDQASDQG